jgi:hypothetical protein
MIRLMRPIKPSSRHLLIAAILAVATASQAAPAFAADASASQVMSSINPPLSAENGPTLLRTPVCPVWRR